MINKTICLLILVIMLPCCYPQRLLNEEGEIINKRTLNKGKAFIYRSYAKDSVLVKGFYLNTIDDEVSKRVFTSNDITKIKKILKKCNGLPNTNYVIKKSELIANNLPYGLYYLKNKNLNKFNGDISIPLLYLEEQIFINCEDKDDSRLNEVEQFRDSYSKYFESALLNQLEAEYLKGIEVIPYRLLR